MLGDAYFIRVYHNEFLTSMFKIVSGNEGVTQE